MVAESRSLWSVDLEEVSTLRTKKIYFSTRCEPGRWTILDPLVAPPLHTNRQTPTVSSHV